jgi:hypothetical protein
MMGDVFRKMLLGAALTMYARLEKLICKLKETEAGERNIADEPVHADKRAAMLFGREGASSGPPKHWVDRVKKYAPELLDPQKVTYSLYDQYADKGREHDPSEMRLSSERHAEQEERKQWKRSPGHQETHGHGTQAQSKKREKAFQEMSDTSDEPVQQQCRVSKDVDALLSDVSRNGPTQRTQLEGSDIYPWEGERATHTEKKTHGMAEEELKTAVAFSSGWTNDFSIVEAEGTPTSERLSEYTPPFGLINNPEADHDLRSPSEDAASDVSAQDMTWFSFDRGGNDASAYAGGRQEKHTEKRPESIFKQSDTIDPVTCIHSKGQRLDDSDTVYRFSGQRVGRVSQKKSTSFLPGENAYERPGANAFNTTQSALLAHDVPELKRPLVDQCWPPLPGERPLDETFDRNPLSPWPLLPDELEEAKKTETKGGLLEFTAARRRLERVQKLEREQAGERWSEWPF